MSKLIIGLMLGFVVALPATAVAASYNLPWTKNIYNVSDPDRGSRTTSVSTFNDGGNKCYVAHSTNRYSELGNNVAISCVKL